MAPRKLADGKRRSGSQVTPPRSGEEMRALARAAALSAISRLTALSNSEDERVALAATQELLNRAFGKITAAAGDEAGAPVPPLVVKILRFGDEGADLGAAEGTPPQAGGGA